MYKHVSYHDRSVLQFIAMVGLPTDRLAHGDSTKQNETYVKIFGRERLNIYYTIVILDEKLVQLIVVNPFQRWCVTSVKGL